MNILFRNIPDGEIRTGAVILPLCEDYGREIYDELDSRSGGFIRRIIDSREFTGTHGQLSLVHCQEIGSERLLLVGLGKKAELTSERIRQSGGKAFSYLRGVGIRDVALSMTLFHRLAGLFWSSYEPAFYFVEGGLLNLYRFEKYKKAENGKEIDSITMLDADRGFPLRWLQASVSAVRFARDLVNTPANDMTPSIMSTLARSLSGRRMKIKVLDQKEIEKEGMGAYLSVTRGSHEPPQFIVIHHRGAGTAPVVLIGKSITFDSGGISIKPAEGMGKMKYDMAGGAAVLAVMRAVKELELPVHVVGILPAAENLPGGGASKPGDVVRTITGKTVEIVSTDAEGRLALADAIGYAIKYLKPQAIIDIATLTGACSIAFGNEAIAMMGNSEDLMSRLRKASDEVYERVWQMPLYDEYKEYLKSDAADLKNTGGRSGSLIAAAYFLKEFAGETPWVHLDIAGTAWIEKDKPYSPKGATGVGVRLLLNLLKELTV